MRNNAKGEQKYTVRYRSGKTFRLVGRLVVGLLTENSTLETPTILSGPKHAAILDPRAVVTDSSGSVVYDGTMVTEESMERMA